MQIEIAVPYACVGIVSEAIIWGIKSVGHVLQFLTFAQYILPYSGGFVAHGVKTNG